MSSSDTHLLSIRLKFLDEVLLSMRHRRPPRRIYYLVWWLQLDDRRVTLVLLGQRLHLAVHRQAIMNQICSLIHFSQVSVWTTNRVAFLRG